MSVHRKMDPSYFNKYTVIFGFFGLAASVIQNGILRRPILSGVHRHALFTLAGGVIGSFSGVFERKRFGKRDFYIDDYVQRHPDDFQKAPPKKMSEYYEIWMPVR